MPRKVGYEFNPWMLTVSLTIWERKYDNIKAELIYECVEWMQVPADMIELRALVNTVMNIQKQFMVRNFLSILATVNVMQWIKFSVLPAVVITFVDNAFIFICTLYNNAL
jgi:hypothetical protein